MPAYFARLSENGSRWMWLIRSPPLTYSITKQRWACVWKQECKLTKKGCRSWLAASKTRFSMRMLRKVYQYQHNIHTWQLPITLAHLRNRELIVSWESWSHTPRRPFGIAQGGPSLYVSIYVHDREQRLTYLSKIAPAEHFEQCKILQSDFEPSGFWWLENLHVNIRGKSINCLCQTLASWVVVEETCEVVAWSLCSCSSILTYALRYDDSLEDADSRCGWAIGTCGMLCAAGELRRANGSKYSADLPPVRGNESFVCMPDWSMLSDAVT